MCNPSNIGFVSEIQRFSLGDGGGIRTTVFMQGCNLRCPWCHNPETLNKKGALLLYKNLCVSCGRCKKVCPENIINIINIVNNNTNNINNCVITDRNKCILCGKCESACMNGAIKLSGKYMTPNEVYGVVSQDIEFYNKSDGGVTISGGEPLLQADFCVEFAKKCFENNINVIIDTAGDVPYDIFELINQFVNNFYFDLKTTLENYSKIGADGKRIYDNLSRLSAISKIIARIPIIPGFNDSCEIMQRLAGFLADINIHEAYFLPFHRLGSGKYKALGVEYAFEDCIPAASEFNKSIEHFIGIFLGKNIKILLEE